MGTKIQQYDLEKKTKDVLVDIQGVYESYTDPLTSTYKSVKDLFSAIDVFMEDQGKMNEKTEALINNMDMVVYASVGEEDRESFAYDEATGNILKHEVYDKEDILKFEIVFEYTNVSDPSLLTGSMKRYKTDMADVEVASSYTYDANGNIIGIQHTKTTTPFPEETPATP